MKIINDQTSQMFQGYHQKNPSKDFARVADVIFER